MCLWNKDDQGSNKVCIQGIFFVHFMAEIRLYSQWQIISFFPNFCPKIPNPKNQKICCQRFLGGLKPEKMLY